MNPVVANLISKALADAFCTWALAQSMQLMHRHGTLHERTDELVARYGSDTFNMAHAICDAAMLNGEPVGAWRE